MTKGPLNVAGDVSDYVAGPVIAGPQLVISWASRASKMMKSNEFKAVRQMGSKYLNSLRGDVMRDIGRWAKTPAATKLGRSLGVAGVVISFANHRADGDRILAAVAKTAVEGALASLGAEVGSALERQ